MKVREIKCYLWVNFLNCFLPKTGHLIIQCNKIILLQYLQKDNSLKNVKVS
jgi:hypothetical protein